MISQIQILCPSSMLFTVCGPELILLFTAGSLSAQPSLKSLGLWLYRFCSFPLTSWLSYFWRCGSARAEAAVPTQLWNCLRSADVLRLWSWKIRCRRRVVFKAIFLFKKTAHRLTIRGYVVHNERPAFVLIHCGSLNSSCVHVGDLLISIIWVFCNLVTTSGWFTLRLDVSKNVKV